jgi:hypothetical protein
VKVRCDEGIAIRIGPEPCVIGPRGSWRSVGRGTHRPAIEPRKVIVPGADAFVTAEGNMGRGDIASPRSARRGRRPWHVRKLFVREPGDLSLIRGVRAAGSRREGEEP